MSWASFFAWWVGVSIATAGFYVGYRSLYRSPFKPREPEETFEDHGYKRMYPAENGWETMPTDQDPKAQPFVSTMPKTTDPKSEFVFSPQRSAPSAGYNPNQGTAESAPPGDKIGRPRDFTSPVGAKVPGYVEQSEQNLANVRAIKEYEERGYRYLDGLVPHVGTPGIDGRLLAMARSHLELACMLAVKAIMRPTRIVLPEDNGQPK